MNVESQGTFNANTTLGAYVLVQFRLFFFLTSEKQDNMLQLREEPEVFQSNILQEMLLGCIGNKIIDQ